MFNEIKHIVAGVEFQAIRMERPIPHWRPMVVETGYIYEAGVFKSASKPKLWESMEEIARIVGHERFSQEALELR